MSKVNSEAYTDISIIIDMMPVSLRKKLSPEFICFVNINKDKNYVSNINPNLPLNKQNIRKETKEIMAIIYREYICTSSKKQELLAEDEDILREEEKSKLGFNYKNIFAKKEDITRDKEEIKALTIKEEGYIERIINRIKNMFKK